MITCIIATGIAACTRKTEPVIQKQIVFESASGAVAGIPSMVVTAAGTINSAQRVNLTVRLSLDDCQSWQYSRTLEEGRAGYSDIAFSPDGEWVYIVYEQGMYHSGAQHIMFAKVNLAWMMNTISN